MKNWGWSRGEAEGADGKESSEAHPRSGLQRASDAARRPFCLAPHGLRWFWRWPALLAGSRWQGYRHCTRALASAKTNSNATHSSISTGSWLLARPFREFAFAPFGNNCRVLKCQTEFHSRPSRSATSPGCSTKPSNEHSGTRRKIEQGARGDVLRFCPRRGAGSMCAG